MQTAVAGLAAQDRVMAGLVSRHGRCRIAGRTGLTHFAYLARSIVFQQLAGAAASTIHGRFAALMDGDVSAQAVLGLRTRQLRGAGLSENKARSVQDLAQKVVAGEVQLDRIARQRDESIIDHLVQVRGIGRWTVEMFLMFQLRRLDVWPTLDLGVRKGYQQAYGLTELPKPRELESLGDDFRPYRSVAAWYCWRAADGDG